MPACVNVFQRFEAGKYLQSRPVYSGTAFYFPDSSGEREAGGRIPEVIFPEEDTLFRNQYDREAGAFFDAGMPGGKWLFYTFTKSILNEILMRVIDGLPAEKEDDGRGCSEKTS